MRRTKSIYLSALAAVLLLGCMVALVGTTYARYQAALHPKTLAYQAKEYASVYLGKSFSGETLNEFESTWESEGDSMSLTFCVANGKDKDTFAEEDQKVTIRLAASLGMNSANVVVNLAVPSADGNVIYYEGTSRTIMENTPLYASFGAGCLYTFLDDDGKELAWSLTGGGLSVLPMKMYVRGVSAGTAESPILLQLQASGDVSGR